MSKIKADWVVSGGKLGEIAHCTRCGVGLDIALPQPIYIVVACSEAFVSHHAHCEPGAYHAPPVTTPTEWLDGRDIGTSSLTIFHVMTGRPTPHRAFDVPQDPADFGRCYRLLKLFPAWLTRLPEVAEKFPAWRKLVDHWAEMTALYEEELLFGSAPKLYALMRSLRSEAA